MDTAAASPILHLSRVQWACYGHFVTTVSFRALLRPLELNLLSDLAKIISIMLGIYLVLKVGDLLQAGEVGLMFSEGWLSLLFLAEMILGVIVPIVLFGIRRVRKSSTRFFWGAACVLAGLALNRTNVALLALDALPGATYFPHWMEIVIATAAIAAGILIFALAVRYLPVLPYTDPRRKYIIPFRWPLWKIILAGLALSLATIAVILWLQPSVYAVTPQVESTSALPPQTFAFSLSENCKKCHGNQEALVNAGADRDELARLTVEPELPRTPHGRLGCITCHEGTGGTEDADAAHTGVITDPSMDDSNSCLSCHHDLPDEFPQDRLRTPHDEVSHGQTVNVFCSDCHGAAGHGFDPVSGRMICPMKVCLDCHQERQLDSKLTDCSACHVGPHDLTVECNVCHQSTEAWKDVEMDVHPLELVDKHVEARCFDCHQAPNFAGLQYTCSNCHQRPHDFGNDDCTECHSPAADWTATSVGDEHSFPTNHDGTNGNCTLCHPSGDTSEFSCETCHGQSSMQVHEAKGMKDIASKCVPCHPQGQKP